MKRIAAALAAAMLLGALMSGCSGGDTESRDEKPVTRKVADEAVKEMRAPLEKARDVKRQAEDHLGRMQKGLKE